MITFLLQLQQKKHIVLKTRETSNEISLKSKGCQINGSEYTPWREIKTYLSVFLWISLFKLFVAINK